MQYSFIKSCLVALAVVSGVVADATPGFDAFTQPLTPGTSIPAGSTYTIKWTPSAPAGKVSIVLLEGSSNITLQLGPTIASAIDSTTGSYDWKVPSSMTPVFPVYGLKIQLDSDPTTFQYSTYFSISGLTTASASGSTSVSASTTVTVVVSSVPATVTTATSTLSASLVTISSNGTSVAATSSAGIYSNTTMTTKTAASASGAAGTATSTSSSATATKSSAAGNVAIGGTGLLGAMMVALGMLL